MKTKNKTIGILVILMIIGLSSLVSAYSWLCLEQGELTPQGNECDASCCTMCVNDNGYGAPFYRCADEPMCTCGSNNNDFEAPVITINSPSNGNAYGQRAVLWDISLSETARIQYKNLNDNYGWKDMCSNCNSYSRSKSFDEGINNYMLRAIDYAGNIGYKNISFMVDSRNPNIRETTPNGAYGGGLFTVEYDEVNLQSVKLYYNNNVVELNNCENGERKICSIDVDLSSYEGQEVQYYFEVYDAVNFDQSRVESFMVDSVTPTMTVNSPLNGETSDERKVLFDVNVDKDVTLEYIDYDDRNPRWNRMCNNCNSYNNEKSLSDGINKIVGIRATDKAGNYDEENVSVSVDSKKPRISNTDPRRNKYGSGLFSVEYTEDNLMEVFLHYGVNPEEHVVQVYGCEAGSRKVCSIDVDLSSYEGQEIEYYFVVNDISTSVSSRVSNIFVDSVTPTMTVNSPINGNYNSRYLLFDVNVDEDVTLEYSDNGGSFRRLCRNCNSYNNEKSFSRGTHTINIRAVDDAGNYDEENVSVNVNY